MFSDMIDSDPLLARVTNLRDAALKEAAEWDGWIKRYMELRGPVATASVPQVTNRRSAKFDPKPEVGATLRMTQEYISTMNRPVPTREMLAQMTKWRFVNYIIAPELAGVPAVAPRGKFMSQQHDCAVFRLLL